jgi:hypothetical protein
VHPICLQARSTYTRRSYIQTFPMLLASDAMLLASNAQRSIHAGVFDHLADMTHVVPRRAIATFIQDDG